MNGPGARLPLPFGPYELLLRLGHGGMGQVFLARRTTVAGGDSLCVVKTLKAELADDREYVGRFLDEVRTVMLLRHSSISHVFDAGQFADTYYMAMEHLAGVTGKELFRAAASGGLDVGLALLVMEDVLGALAYAHGFTNPLTGEPLAVVHRDVSPHNVIITFEGEVKLIDFGLAESVLKQEHTESQVVMGKIAYMSPEQARGEEVEGACDQFAAAVMLYELVTGERFYGARNNSEIWTVVGFGGFRPDRFGALPAPLVPLLDRALAASPRDRFPDCRAFQAALEAVHVQHYPYATRSRLRAFMQEAFAEEREKRREELARAAALASEVQQFTQSASASVPSNFSANPTAPAREPPRPLPPVVTTAPAPATSSPSLPSASESLRVPRSRAPTVALALGLVVALAGVGVLLWPPSAARERAATAQASASVQPPAAASVAPSSDDAVPEESPSSIPVEEPPPPTEAASSASGADAEGDAQKRSPSSKRMRPSRPRGEPEALEDGTRGEAAKAEPPREDAPRSEPPKDEAASVASTSESPKAPSAMTNADALAIVKSCKLGCASSVLALPAVKDGSVLHQAPNALLTNCARRCLTR